MTTTGTEPDEAAGKLRLARTLTEASGAECAKDLTETRIAGRVKGKCLARKLCIGAHRHKGDKERQQKTPHNRPP